MYYKRIGSPHLALLHIELEGERSEESKAFHLPTLFSSPTHNSGSHSATGMRTSTATTSNSTSSTGYQRQPQDNSNTMGTRMAANLQVQESPFNFESLRAALPEIETRIERVEHRVSANENTLGHVQFRLDNIDDEISTMKGKVRELETRILGFDQDMDWIRDDLDISSARVEKVDKLMNLSNVTNSNLIDLYDSLNESVKDIKKKVDGHDCTTKNLMKHAQAVKAHLSERIEALDQDLQTHVKEDHENHLILEAALAGMKESMKSSAEESVNVHIPDLHFNTKAGEQIHSYIY